MSDIIYTLHWAHIKSIGAKRFAIRDSSDGSYLVLHRFEGRTVGSPIYRDLALGLLRWMGLSYPSSDLETTGRLRRINMVHGIEAVWHPESDVSILSEISPTDEQAEYEAPTAIGKHSAILGGPDA